MFDGADEADTTFPTERDILDALKDAEERGSRAAVIIQKQLYKPRRREARLILKDLYVACEELRASEPGSKTARIILRRIMDCARSLDSFLGGVLKSPIETNLPNPADTAVTIVSTSIEDTFHRTHMRIEDPIRIDTSRFEKLGGALFRTIDDFDCKERRTRILVERMERATTLVSEDNIEARDIPDVDMDLAVGPSNKK